MPTRAPALLGVALALTLGLSACGGDDDATADPPVAPSTTTPSTDPTASPTAEPPPTQAPAGETARQFIERWFALEKYAQNTGDTASYRAISKGCKSCLKTANSIDRFYEAGGYVHGGGATIIKLSRQKSVAGTAVYIANLTYEPTRYRRSADASEERFTGGPIRYEITLNAGAPWNVTEFFRLVDE